MLNHITVQGRLTANPELNYTQQNIPYTRFCVANDTGATSSSGEKIVYFIDVTAWRKQAEFACNYLAKGRLVIVEGELTTRTYVDKYGNNRKAVEVNASRLHFCDSKPQTAGNPAADFAEGYGPRQAPPAPPAQQGGQSTPPPADDSITSVNSDDSYPF